MIVRILGEGQWDVEDTLLEVLNTLDGAVEAAVDNADGAAFGPALVALLDVVRSQGTRLEDDALENSDLILPPSDATLDEVRAMLTEDGLVPDFMSTRFVSDRGLTARMTATMFLLGGLFVVFFVGLIVWVNSPGLALIIGLAGLGIAWWQWYKSDTVALKAMRARVVTPEEAPELHAMVDRLCALADMPKPVVAISYTDMPNAFATGRSPSHSAVCVTTGILDRLSMDELEGVLAHELSHVAHRDVLVMTLASSAAIVTGMAMRGAQWGGLMGGFGRRNNDSNGVPVWLLILVVSIIVYAVSFLAIKLLSRYRELAADRAGAYLTGDPSALARALTKISGQMAAIPQKDLRQVEPMNAFFIAPAVSGVSWSTLTSTHPSLEQRLGQLAKIANDLGRPLDGGFPADPGQPPQLG